MRTLGRRCQHLTDRRTAHSVFSTLWYCAFMQGRTLRLSGLRATDERSTTIGKGQRSTCRTQTVQGARLLTSRNWRAGFAGAGHLFKLTGLLTRTDDPLTRIPALTQRTSGFVQPETIRAQHPACQRCTFVSSGAVDQVQGSSSRSCQFKTVPVHTPTPRTHRFVIALDRLKRARIVALRHTQLARQIRRERSASP